MYRAIISFVILIFLSSCSIGTAPLQLAKIPPSTKIIGLIPATKNEFILASTGLTKFEDSYESVNVTDWNVNDVIFEAAKKALSDDFVIVRPHVDGLTDQIKRPINVDFGTISSVETEIAKRVHVDTPVDLYIIFAVLNQNLAWPMDVHKGIGMSKIKWLTHTELPSIHTHMVFYLVDAKTQKIITYSYLTHSHNKYDENYPLENSARKFVRNIEWHGEWREYSQEEKKNIHDQFMTLLYESVFTSVNKLKDQK